MLYFDAAPAVPLSYSRLKVLTAAEISIAQASGYVGEEADLEVNQKRPGLAYDDDFVPDDSLTDWRTRMYIVWFCYIYENFTAVRKPFFAIEELILEFRGLDALHPNFGSLYAGAGGWEPLSPEAHQKALAWLEPLYFKAIYLLGTWADSHGGLPKTER